MERGKLKLVFSEIIEGYSLVTSKLFGDLKIKHINNFDAAKTDIKNHHYFEKAVEQGLPKKEEKLLNESPGRKKPKSRHNLLLHKCII